MSKNVLVVVADGSEEMETVICVDVLRRAQVSVTLASLGSAASVVCSRQVTLVSDTNLSSIKPDVYDAIVLPGGLGGAQAFAGNTELHSLLRLFATDGKIVAAICAAPIALAAAKVAQNKTITSHPSVKPQLQDAKWFKEYSEERVVVDGNFVTSRGPGTTFEFALSLVKLLCGVEKANEISGPMMLQPGLVII
ncbi:class I glutamine amidotransferase-like protein [Obelidium mucronatum]|nr:class I glutamine amidotransferase-like protein [Obelidium mucronatum]